MSVMTDRTVAALCFAVFAFALVIGYVWGRWNGKAELGREYRDGRDDGYDLGWSDACARNATLISPRVPEPAVEMLAAPDEAFWPDEPGPRIYPELAALAADDHPDGYVAPSSPKRSADDGESGRDRGTPAIGWVDQQLYLNAVTRACIEAREHAEMEDFHADVARVDDQIARWGDWARESLKPRWQVFSELVA